jgi:hypothetical protein
MHSRSAPRIRKTLIEAPKTMCDRNEGICITADDDFHYNAAKSELTIIIKNQLHGILDGGTTDRVCYHFITDADGKIIPGSIRVQIITGVRDKEELYEISRSRNFRQSQKFYSLTNLTGKHDWLREILNAAGYPASENGQPGLIAYEEFASGQENVKDLVCYLHLFHPYYEGGERHPVRSITSPTTVFKNLQDEESKVNITGYENLAPIILQLLDLRDYVWSTMETAYASHVRGRRSRLGRQLNPELRYLSPFELPFGSPTKYQTNWKIPVGLLYPVIASLRCLIAYTNNGPRFIKEPKSFWDKHGSKLMGSAFSMMGQTAAKIGNQKWADTSNFGKNSAVWTALYEKANSLAGK